MNEPSAGIVVLVLISVVAAVVGHLRITQYLVACAVSAVVSAVLFQVAVFFQLGYLDPFFLIAIAVSLVIAFVVAMVVGVPFAAKRKATRSGTPSG